MLEFWETLYNVNRRQVMFVLYVAFAITGVYHGTGQHTTDIQPPTEVPIGLKVLRSSTVLHINRGLILRSDSADMR
jgi:hypothetical protein